MTTQDGKDRAAEEAPGESVRERSAEEREITAPTPADVRAKAAGRDGGDEDPEPPAADSQAP
ncbi:MULTISPECIES: hypothetical protein [Kitasatospora]|uniref:Uncharacterized protein n=1 Tax=Kitasatospora setae (strain ATCC 33774 / DSM 43861 / JCM 3304 / KCC A-0304 / NBRC 14216 / KM-6054) TaxID=452652 RepID=E4N566_KITSK|nr:MULTISPECIES: hypothetical protein [Kitasatospora]BAJ26347.1 hypothetical protein KSE_05010 [Kitasatospora setae KM-6054]